MSKTVIWQYNSFIHSRKEKLTSMLISEIIFLKSKLKNHKHLDEQNYLKYGLDKLEYLLNKLKIYRQEIPETDFDKIILIIYQIFKEIAQKLE